MPEFAMRRFPAGTAGVEPFRRSRVVCRVAWVFNELSVKEARVRGGRSGFRLVAVCRGYRSFALLDRDVYVKSALYSNAVSRSPAVQAGLTPNNRGPRGLQRG
jgi:hypothetical protein